MPNNRILLVTYPYKSATVGELVANLEEILVEISPLTSIGRKTLPISTCASCKRESLIFSADMLKDRKSNFTHKIEWLILFLLIQIEIAGRVVRLRRHTETVLFFLGPVYPIPSIASKLLGMKSVLVIGGSHSRHSEHKPWIDRKMSHLLERFAVQFIDRIGLEHKNEIPTLSKGDRFESSKFSPLAARFVDIDGFKPTCRFEDRPKAIGFLGRLDKVKGFTEILDAIPEILERLPDYEIHIIGDGPLMGEAKRIAMTFGERSPIVIHGWIDRASLPSTIAGLRLMLMPSYSEGLPTVLLEAMASGTPILCSPVGAIPGVISDGVNGFLLRNRNHVEFTSRIEEILENEDLPTVSENARMTVTSTYTKARAVERYRRLVMGWEES